MDSTRALKRLLFVGIAFFASVITVGAVTTPGDQTNGPAARPAPASGYSHDELQRAANMTEQMSAPSANTGSAAAHAADEQLRRSQDPGYLGALEEHKADLDRMLAKETR